MKKKVNISQLIHYVHPHIFIKDAKLKDKFSLCYKHLIISLLWVPLTHRNLVILVQAALRMTPVLRQNVLMQRCNSLRFHFSYNCFLA